MSGRIRQFLSITSSNEPPAKNSGCSRSEMPLFIDILNPIRHPVGCRLTFEMMTKELA